MMLLFLLSFVALVSTSALPSPIHPRACTIIRPTKFYRISSRLPTTSESLGPFPNFNTNPQTYFFNFDLRQTGDGTKITEQEDIIATFTNIPCNHPPYRVEFLFEPQSDYGYSYNTHVDLFNFQGKVPRNATGAGVPTWNNVKGKKGAKVGNWKMPEGEDQVRQTYRIGKGKCGKEVSFWASIEDKGKQSGLVLYPQQYAGVDSGLRVVYGC